MDDATAYCSIIAGIFIIFGFGVLIGSASSGPDVQTQEYVDLVSSVEYNANSPNVIVVYGAHSNPRFTELDAQKIGKIIPGERYHFTVKYDQNGGYWRVCNATLVKNGCTDSSKCG